MVQLEEIGLIDPFLTPSIVVEPTSESLNLLARLSPDPVLSAWFEEVGLWNLVSRAREVLVSRAKDVHTSKSGSSILKCK